jgi:hypothetical protein
MGGQHQTVGDLFTNRKTMQALRSGWPLILAGDGSDVLWVCGLAVAEKMRITKQTSSVAVLRWTSATSEPCAPM